MTEEPSAQLTPKEKEALTWAALGIRAAGIAWRMGISTRTAENHLFRAKNKLAARTTPQAVAIALQQGIIGI